MMLYKYRRSYKNTYSSPSPKRSYRLIVKNETFYVNGFYLAEISPYFEALFFNERFIESKTKSAYLGSIDPEELHVFLNYICPVKNNYERKEITVDNFYILLYFSNRFLIKQIQYEMKVFIRNNFDVCRKRLTCTKLLIITSYLLNTNGCDEFLNFCYKSLLYYTEEDIQRYLHIIPYQDRDVIIRACNTMKIRIMESELDSTQDDYDIRDDYLRGLINCTDNTTNYVLIAFVGIIFYIIWLV
uniref:BTB domain-containing protein n=1 Tax=Parastrongyloides trichosuri TaxID=131310 RepID=A0A0N4Z2Q4_PARTI